MVVYFLVVPIVGRSLVVVIMCAMKFVIQETVGSVHSCQTILKHAVAGKQNWRRNDRLVLIQYQHVHKYVTSFFLVGCIIAERYAILGIVHHVQF